MKTFEVTIKTTFETKHYKIRAANSVNALNNILSTKTKHLPMGGINVTVKPL